MQIDPPQSRLLPGRIIQSLYRLGFGPAIGRVILLLTTTGRKSGLARVTPLQYDELDGTIYVGSVRGTRADWFRNIVANPCVEVRVQNRRFEGMAEAVTDAHRIADFLELRLERHPRIVGAILKSEGLPAAPSRVELEAYASRLAMVIIRPVQAGELIKGIASQQTPAMTTGSIKDVEDGYH